MSLFIRGSNTVVKLSRKRLDLENFLFIFVFGREPRSPSPEPFEANDRSCSPIPEEMGEEGVITKSDPSKTGSVIANPAREVRRQPSAEIEEIGNDLLNGDSPAIDFGRYQMESCLLDSGNERERIKEGYRHLTIGELKVKLASKSRRGKRACQHFHELEEAVLFLRASCRYLKKFETKESVLEELIASHERLHRRQIGLSDYRFGVSSDSLDAQTARGVYGA